MQEGPFTIHVHKCFPILPRMSTRKMFSFKWIRRTWQTPFKSHFDFNNFAQQGNFFSAWLFSAVFSGNKKYCF